MLTGLRQGRAAHHRKALIREGHKGYRYDSTSAARAVGDADVDLRARAMSSSGAEREQKEKARAHERRQTSSGREPAARLYIGTADDVSSSRVRTCGYSFPIVSTRTFQ